MILAKTIYAAHASNEVNAANRKTSNENRLSPPSASQPTFALGRSETANKVRTHESSLTRSANTKAQMWLMAG